jgi:hypothetical protein
LSDFSERPHPRRFLGLLHQAGSHPLEGPAKSRSATIVDVEQGHYERFEKRLGLRGLKKILLFNDWRMRGQNSA